METIVCISVLNDRKLSYYLITHYIFRKQKPIENQQFSSRTIIILKHLKIEIVSLWQEFIPSLVSVSISGPTERKKIHFLFCTTYFY